MTHAEATSGDVKGRQSACPGELVHEGDHEDVDYSAGAPRHRVVSVHACPACGSLLSSSGGELLNVYLPPRRLAGELAKALDAGRG